jgi:hypothetical protein
MSLDNLLIITALDCGACADFKSNHFDELLKNLKAGNIAYRHLDYKSRSQIIPELNSKHPNLSNYVKWVPSFLLVNNEQYKKNTPNPNVKVMNGVIDNGILSRETDSRNVYQRTTKSILKWLSDSGFNVKNLLKKSDDVKKQIPITQHFELFELSSDDEIEFM